MSDEKNKTEISENEALQYNVKNNEIIEDNESVSSASDGNTEQISLLDGVLEPDEENDNESSSDGEALPHYAEANLFGEAETEDNEAQSEAFEDVAPETPEIEEGEEAVSDEDVHPDQNDENTDAEDLDEFDDQVKEPEKTRKVDNLFDFIEIFVFTLAAVFIITSFFLRYSIVDGPSMQNTLQDDDKLLISNFMYEPECGDVIVVHSDVLNKVIVKRVIATEGQTVKITSTDVYVDGEKLIEDYVYTGDYSNVFGYSSEYKYLPEGEVFEITVPEGDIFVMGDHRNKSEDSRSIGTISEKAVIGKVILRFAPFDSFGKID